MDAYAERSVRGCIYYPKHRTHVYSFVSSTCWQEQISNLLDPTTTIKHTCKPANEATERPFYQVAPAYVVDALRSGLGSRTGRDERLPAESTGGCRPRAARRRLAETEDLRTEPYRREMGRAEYRGHGCGVAASRARWPQCGRVRLPMNGNLFGREGGPALYALGGRTPSMAIMIDVIRSGEQ